MSDILLRLPENSPQPPQVPPMPDSDPELDSIGQGLVPLMLAVSPESEEDRQRAELYIPPVPQTGQEIGVSNALIEDLIIKTLYAQGETIGRDLASELGLKFSLIEPTIEQLKRQRLIETKGSLGFGVISAVFGLSETGRSRARECLEHNLYVGAVPVPISQYETAVRAQRLKSGWLTEDALKAAYRGINVSTDVLSQIGPAVNSGKSFLLYGQPGNGKTYLAEALFSLNSSPIYVPYAIEYHGLIIKVFDSVHHQRMEEAADMTTSISADAQYDGRWVRCRRPFIVTGGELTISMLELGYNTAAKIYDAPLQLKANNGIYLIDDFGRQKASPAEVLNRWIVPMDRRVDYLTFREGGKVEVPFETFLMFSTNLQPEKLGDEAFLRRIQYKMFLANPNRNEYEEIFSSFARSQELEVAPQVVSRFIEKHYVATGKRFRRCQPRDVISHAMDLINFKQLPLVLTDDLLDRAFTSCFASASMEE